MNLNAWLSHIESLHPVTIDLDLSRIKQVASALNVEKPAVKVITISGTNGKGTTIATLDALYSAAGYKVGTYTSPHLCHFNERLKINGQNIDETVLCQAFEAIDLARNNITLTYFEFITLAAFYILATQHLDIWLLEVGMGGRLDAVNIIDPDVSIITNIDLDHQAWLGETREAIGKEKLGITRPGIPLIYGEKTAPLGFVEYTRTNHIPLFQRGMDFDFNIDAENTWTWKGKKEHKNLPWVPFILDNISCALQAIECLASSFPVSEMHIKEGLKQITLQGRCEIIEQEPWQLLDVAHNPQGSHYLASFLETYRSEGKIKAVFSALSDKDISGIVAPLLQRVDEWFVAGLPSISRGSTASEIHNIICEKTKAPVHQYTTVKEAYEAACEQVTPEEGIVIFGSFHTVAEVLVSREKK